MFVVVQVVKSLLAMTDEDLRVQIDGYDSLWGETGEKHSKVHGNSQKRIFSQGAVHNISN